MKNLRLGITIEDEQLLVNDVSIIFHLAATVRFDEPLTDAVLMNTRGTRELVNLAKKMKNLEVRLSPITVHFLFFRAIFFCVCSKRLQRNTRYDEVSVLSIWKTFGFSRMTLPS